MGNLKDPMSFRGLGSSYQLRYCVLGIINGIVKFSTSVFPGE
jgi:hypothetical protein